MASAKFSNPPVVELVIGIHFKLLENFTAAHAGIFYAEKLQQKGFSRLEQQEPVQGMRLGPTGPEPEPLRSSWRIWMFNQDNILLQLQADRLVVNWRREEGNPYPSYETLAAYFKNYWELFKDWVATQELGSLEPHQYELTYIDIVPLDKKYWSSWEELNKIIKIRGPETLSQFLGTMKAFTMFWAFAKEETEAFTTLQLASANLKDDRSTEALQMRWTTICPAANDSAEWSGLDEAHKAIGDAFLAFTQEEVQQQWQQPQS